MTIQCDLLKYVSRGGCAAKIEAARLQEVLQGINFGQHPNLLVGSETSDDASVWKLTEDIAIIQTTDFFPPMCSDPYDFGQIAAANALSDVYAMGGTPITALNLVMFPAGEIDLMVLREILKGGADKAAEAGVVLTGGHSIDDATPKYGMAVTGVIHPERIIKNCDCRLDDVLILTKPLGSGQIMAAYKKNQVSEDVYQQALTWMKTLNSKACDVMKKYGIVAATDVTGFGFLGHAMEMARGSKVKLIFDSQKIPLMTGALEIARQDFAPCSIEKNKRFLSGQMVCQEKTNVDPAVLKLMLDPQTSGGILMSVPKWQADQILSDLKAQNVLTATVVGRIALLDAENIFIEVE